MTSLELKAIEQMYKLLSQHIKDLHKMRDTCRENLKDAYEKSPQKGYPDRVDIDTLNKFQDLITKISEIRDWASVLKEEE